MQSPRRKPTPEQARMGYEGERLHMIRGLETACDTGLIACYSLPDAVATSTTGEVFLIELKTQSMYEAPPFDGHGLPVKQARRYMRMQMASSTNIRTLLWINDPDRQTDYKAWLNTLEEGETYDTSRADPRRVFPLSSFTAQPWNR